MSGVRGVVLLLAVLALCLAPRHACGSEGESTMSGSARPGENLLVNSSFEIATNPSHPDCWGRLSSPETVPYDDAALDHTQAYDGRASVRFRVRPNKSGGSGTGWATDLMSFPELSEDTTFVLSAYMKSDRPGVEISLSTRPGDPQSHSFKVTTQWQRYYYTFVVSKAEFQAARERDSKMRVEFGPQTLDKEYTYWVDAVQLEVGQAPTAYVPSPIDRAGGPEAINVRDRASEAAKRPTIDCEELSVAYSDRLEGVCEVTFVLRNRTDEGKDLDLSLALEGSRYSSATPVQARQRIRANPGDQRVAISHLKFPIELRNEKRFHSVVKAALTITEAKSGNVVFTRQYDNLLVPPLFDAYVERNYYSREASGSIIGTLTGVPAERLGEFGIAVSFSDESVLGWGEKRVDGLRGAETEIDIPISALPPGRYPCTIVLTRNGKALVRVEKELVKLAPGKVEVKVDRRRQCLIVDGEPFIPYFLGQHFVHERPYMWEEMAERGFNGCFTNFPIYGGVAATNDQILQALDLAQQHGLKVILWVEPDMSPAVGPANLAEAKGYLERIVPLVRDHPAVVGYLCGDEWWDATYSKQLHELGKTLDPYKPWLQNQCGDAGTWDHVSTREWAPRWAETMGDTTWWEVRDYFTDAISWDVYIFGVSPLGRVKPGSTWAPSLKRMVEVTVDQAMKVMAAPDRSPMFMCGQVLGYGDDRWYREPTPQEETGEFYQLLINGFRGEYYFMYKPQASELWDRYRQQASELKVLGPVLLSLEEEEVYSTNPDVRVLAKRYDGARYLIASNVLDTPAETECVVGNAGTGVYDVLFENRTVRAVDGRIRDRFDGYGRHVYRMAIQ